LGRALRFYFVVAVFVACQVSLADETASAQAVEKETVGTRLPTITVTAPAPSPARPKRRQKPASNSSIQPTAGNRADSAEAGAKSTQSPPVAASEMTFSGQQVNERAFSRPGEALEIAPGLIVTQHSGEGKANQYFLRGYNLDHGTDLAISVDDMPINMRTHAHGQGYSDLNFLIPELIGSVNVRKGPYFADEGDFSSVGALHIGLIDSLDKKIAQVTFGSFGYARLLGMGSAKAGEGTILVAGELGGYNGPWNNPDDVRKLNGLVRYSQGLADNGFTFTGMAYTNRWNSTDQVPLRAIASGQLGLYDALDPTDGGNTNRFSLSARLAQTDDSGAWRSNIYMVKSTLNLFNNFTYFLTHPTDGDQFHQHDDRILTGANASRTVNGTLGALPTETTVGVQSRFDDINLALTDTFARQFLSNIRSDSVTEGSVGIYAQNTLHWTDWFKTTVGWRGDLYSANVNSLYDSANSGKVASAIGSPKFAMVLGPFNKTEYFFSAGAGFHSNDARGVTITEEPTDPTTKLGASPLLVRTKGAEVGVRTKMVPGLNSSISLFILDQASEIIFNGDAGDTSASRPSQRIGVEWTNDYRPISWVGFDADFAATRARFVGGYDLAQEVTYQSLAGYPQAQIGNAPGNYIPGAPAIVASVGVMLGEKIGWFGALRYRYLGPRPLTEDDAFISPATGLVNGQMGYRFENGWQIRLDAFNLLNSKSDQIDYAYGSLIKSDNLFAACNSATPPPPAVCQNGVMDRVLHPVEPLALRLTVAGAF
jgi:outer membrane receptor protein involved in Fe transport